MKKKQIWIATACAIVYRRTGGGNYFRSKEKVRWGRNGICDEHFFYKIQMSGIQRLAGVVESQKTGYSKKMENGK